MILIQKNIMSNGTVKFFNEVTFDLVQGKKGLNAINIKLI